MISDNWISVNDRMPDVKKVRQWVFQSENVLCIDENDNCFVGYFDGDKWTIAIEGLSMGYQNIDIPHAFLVKGWQPLPGGKDE